MNQKWSETPCETCLKSLTIVMAWNDNLFRKIFSRIIMCFLWRRRRLSQLVKDLHDLSHCKSSYCYDIFENCSGCPTIRDDWYEQQQPTKWHGVPDTAEVGNTYFRIPDHCWQLQPMYFQAGRNRNVKWQRLLDRPRPLVENGGWKMGWWPN